MAEVVVLSARDRMRVQKQLDTVHEILNEVQGILSTPIVVNTNEGLEGNTARVAAYDDSDVPMKSPGRY